MDVGHQWSGRFLGIIGWDPWCLQVQPVTCWQPPVSFVKLGVWFFKFFLLWLVIFLQSWTLTGCISNSTGSFGTNCRFSLFIMAHHFSHYYSWRCWRMVSKVVDVISSSWSIWIIMNLVKNFKANTRLFKTMVGIVDKMENKWTNQ